MTSQFVESAWMSVKVFQASLDKGESPISIFLRRFPLSVPHFLALECSVLRSHVLDRQRCDCIR